MRDVDHIVHRQQVLIRKIRDVTAHDAVGDRPAQVVVVDDPAAGKVENGHTLLHAAELLGVDDPAGGVDQRRVQRDVVGLRHQGVEPFGTLHFPRQSPRGLHRDERIVADDVHAQIERGVGHHHPDLAQAHHTQRLAHDLLPGELLFIGLHQRGHLGALVLDRG